MKIRASIALAAVLLPGAAFAQKSTDTKKDLPPSTATPIGSTTSTATSTYRISPGDQLDIYVWGDERLQRSMTVLPDGTIAFPLAGTVVAAGHTPNEVENELARLLAPQYKGVPQQVTVSVKQSSGMQVSVIGKVRSPGTFSPTRYLSVLDALAMAGGPTEFADVNDIVILRHQGGKTNVIRAHVGGLLKGKPSGEDLNGGGVPMLLAGDTVIVP